MRGNEYKIGSTLVLIGSLGTMIQTICSTTNSYCSELIKEVEYFGSDG